MTSERRAKLAGYLITAIVVVVGRGRHPAALTVGSDPRGWRASEPLPWRPVFSSEQKSA